MGVGADDAAAPLLAHRLLGVEDVVRLRNDLMLFSCCLSFCVAVFGAVRTDYTIHCLHSDDPARTGVMALVGYYVMHAASNPILGKLSDSVGRKPLLLVGCCGVLGAFSLFVVISDSLTFILLFAALGSIDASNVMYHLMIVDTAFVDLRSGGGYFAYFATKAGVDEPSMGAERVVSSEPLLQRRVGVLFSAIYVVSIAAAGLGFAVAVAVEGALGVRGTIAVAAAAVGPLVVYVAYSLPETAPPRQTDGADDDATFCAALATVYDEQRRGFGVLTATARRRLLLVVTIGMHGAIAGAGSLVTYWAVYKFGFGIGMQTLVMTLGLVAIGGGVSFLQAVLIPMGGLQGPEACIALIGVASVLTVLLAAAFEPWMAFVGVVSIAAAGINPEIRSQITADVPQADQGYVQGAIQTANSIGDALGAFLLLIAFENTTDDDVGHDTHRGKHSLKANVIWHAILGLNLVVVVALLFVIDGDHRRPSHQQVAVPVKT